MKFKKGLIAITIGLGSTASVIGAISLSTSNLAHQAYIATQQTTLLELKTTNKSKYIKGPTRYRFSEVWGSINLPNRIASTFTNEVRDLVWTNRLNLFTHLPYNIAKGHLDVQITEVDDVNGFIKAHIETCWHLDEQGNIHTGYLSPGTDLVIYGFKVDERSKTTQIQSELAFNQQADFLPSQWQNHQDFIKQTIIDQEIVHNLASNNTISKNNISLSQPQAINDWEGTMKLKVSLSGPAVVVNGSNKSISKIVTLTNLKKDKPVYKYKNPNDIFVPTDNTNMFASNYNNEQIKNLIARNKNKLLNHTPNDFNANNVIISENVFRDDVNGILRVHYKINKYYGPDKSIQNNILDPGSYVLIHGFQSKNPNAKTTMVQTSFIFDTQPDFHATQWYDNKKFIVDQLIKQGAIINTNPDKPLKYPDVWLDNATTEWNEGVANNYTGQLQDFFVTMDDTIGLVNGNSQKIEQVITINNFPTVPLPKQPKYIPLYNAQTLIFDYIPAYELDKLNNKTTKEVAAYFNSYEGRKYIKNNVEKFFSGRLKPLQEMYSAPDAVAVSLDEHSVKLKITLGPNDWYNENGKLELGDKTFTTVITNINDGTSGPPKPVHPKPTTIRDKLVFRVTQDFLPSQWETNQEAIKKEIIEQGIVENLIPGTTLEAKNIELKDTNPISHDDDNGILNLVVNIDETKAQIQNRPTVVGTTVTIENLKALNPQPEPLPPEPQPEPLPPDPQPEPNPEPVPPTPPQPTPPQPAPPQPDGDNNQPVPPNQLPSNPQIVQSNSKKSLVIGISIAIPLVLIALILLLVMYRQKKRSPYSRIPRRRSSSFYGF